MLLLKGHPLELPNRLRVEMALSQLLRRMFRGHCSESKNFSSELLANLSQNNVCKTIMKIKPFLKNKTTILMSWLP